LKVLLSWKGHSSKSRCWKAWAQQQLSLVILSFQTTFLVLKRGEKYPLPRIVMSKTTFDTMSGKLPTSVLVGCVWVWVFLYSLGYLCKRKANLKSDPELHSLPFAS
jgi:hypothetical protein